MKITKSDLYNALIEARVALSQSIRENVKSRHLSYVPKVARENIREKIAAYRLLANLWEIDATTYTCNPRDVARVKKALAK